MQRRKLSTPSEKFEVWQMREAGVPFKDLESYFQCSRSTLDRVMREMRAKLQP